MESEYICNYCSRSFTRKYNLLTHIENCHLNESCYCNICGQRFGSPAGLQLHLSRGHNRFNQPLPECDTCGRIFTRKQNITSHMMTVHLQALRPIKCNMCPKLFTTDRNMKRHIRQIHNSKECLTCDECYKQFKSKHSLTLHIQVGHNNVKRPFPFLNSANEDCQNTRIKPHPKCEVCSKVYTSKHNLKRHTRSVHIFNKINHYTHKLSSKSVIAKENLQKHSMQSSPYFQDLTKLNLICDTCNTVFKEEKLLRQHIKNEHEFEDFYKYCKKILLVKYIQNYHDKKQIYNCEFCSYAFGTTDDLKYHMKIHHNIEYLLLTCKVCYGEFYCKQSLFIHKNICFPPADSNACSHCDKLFTNVSSLDFHIKIFHPHVQMDSCITSSTNDCSRSRKCDEFYDKRQHSMTKHYINGSFDSKKNIWKKTVHNSLTSSSRALNSCIRQTESTLSGMSYKCEECATNFKERRSLRRHIRTKHSDSTNFPQCKICKLSFESVKYYRRHLKADHNILLASSITLSKNLENDLNDIYRCEICNIVFEEKLLHEQHKMAHMTSCNWRLTPRCIICVKDFSSRKTLKRHIKKFHCEFQVDELADFGTFKQEFNVQCEECIKNFTDKYHFGVYQKWKHFSKTIIFKCETCKSSYNSFEYAIQRYKQNFDITKSKLYLSELCTAEMSDTESQMGVEPVSNTVNIKSEPGSVKTEPNSDADSDYRVNENIEESWNFILCKSERLSP